MRFTRQILPFSYQYSLAKLDIHTAYDILYKHYYAQRGLLITIWNVVFFVTHDTLYEILYRTIAQKIGQMSNIQRCQMDKVWKKVIRFCSILISSSIIQVRKEQDISILLSFWCLLARICRTWSLIPPASGLRTWNIFLCLSQIQKISYCISKCGWLALYGVRPPPLTSLGFLSFTQNIFRLPLPEHSWPCKIFCSGCPYEENKSKNLVLCSYTL